MRKVHTRFDAAEEAADARTLKVLPQGQIARRQGLLDVRRFLEAVMAPATPGSTVAERDLVRVGIIETEAGKTRIIVGGDVEVVAVERPRLERTDAVSSIGFDIGLVALVRRIGKVREKVGVV